jgi:uncharacterized surface protein with fasciclin (FAS1) repeats
MHSKLLSLATFASLAAAQSMNFTATIISNPNLSNLTQYLGMYPQIVETLSSLTNITLLAPSNEAFTKAVSAAQINALDRSLITALFTYHVLEGTYFSTDFTSKPAFIRTALVDPAYTNLTSGQVVEAVVSDKKVDFYSGLLQKATVTQAVCFMLSVRPGSADRS